MIIKFIMFSHECAKGSIALPETSKPKKEDSSNTSIAQDKIPTDEDGKLTIIFRFLLCS